MIVQEEPLLSVRLTDDGDLVGRFSRDKHEFVSPPLLKALCSLPDTELYKFYSLADSCSVNVAKENGIDKPDIKNTKTNYGIVKTNSFSVEWDPLGDKNKDSRQIRLALFPTIARLNHSCHPNCNHYWSGGSFTVRAVKAIKRGQELTISYMSPLQRADFHERQSRRKILQTEFGFECSCELCECEEDDQENDAMRKRLLDIEQKWSGLGRDPIKALDLAKEQLLLAAKLDLQPGLLAYIELHCVEAASLVLSMGLDDVDMIREEGCAHAGQARTHGTVAYGLLSKEVEIFSSICSSWDDMSNQELLPVVQEAIEALRDIDKRQ